MHKFQSHTAIYFGDDPLARLSQLKFKRFFIVTDPFMAKSGAADHAHPPTSERQRATLFFPMLRPTRRQILSWRGRSSCAGLARIA